MLIFHFALRILLVCTVFGPITVDLGNRSIMARESTTRKSTNNKTNPRDTRRVVKRDSYDSRGRSPRRDDRQSDRQSDRRSSSRSSRSSKRSRSKSPRSKRSNRRSISRSQSRTSETRPTKKSNTRSSPSKRSSNSTSGRNDSPKRNFEVFNETRPAGTSSRPNLPLPAGRPPVNNQQQSTAPRDNQQRQRTPSPPIGRSRSYSDDHQNRQQPNHYEPRSFQSHNRPHWSGSSYSGRGNNQTSWKGTYRGQGGHGGPSTGPMNNHITSKWHYKQESGFGSFAINPGHDLIDQCSDTRGPHFAMPIAPRPIFYLHTSDQDGAQGWTFKRDELTPEIDLNLQLLDKTVINCYEVLIRKGEHHKKIDDMLFNIGIKKTNCHFIMDFSNTYVEKIQFKYSFQYYWFSFHYFHLAGPDDLLSKFGYTEFITTMFILQKSNTFVSNFPSKLILKTWYDKALQENYTLEKTEIRKFWGRGNEVNRDAKEFTDGDRISLGSFVHFYLKKMIWNKPEEALRDRWVQSSGLYNKFLKPCTRDKEGAHQLHPRLVYVKDEKCYSMEQRDLLLYLEEQKVAKHERRKKHEERTSVIKAGDINYKLSGTRLERLNQICGGKHVARIDHSMSIFVPMYWPFGPAWSLCTGLKGPVWSCLSGPSAQFNLDLLAFRASFVFLYWPFGPDSRFFNTWNCSKPAMFYFWKTGQNRFFYYMEMPKTGDVLFLEHQKTASHLI